MTLKDLVSATLVLAFWVSSWGIEESNADEKRRGVELTPEQREIIEKGATEPPFKNEYWDEKRDGIYVDRVSGKPLFSSKAKFDSGTGWPSFFEPLVKGEIIERMDHSQFMKRVEIRAKDSNSHLGHLFDDGPQPSGQRYCVNSASLRFIPKDELEAEGYGEFMQQFASSSGASDEANSEQQTSSVVADTTESAAASSVMSSPSKESPVEDTAPGEVAPAIGGDIPSE